MTKNQRKQREHAVREFIEAHTKAQLDEWQRQRLRWLFGPANTPRRAGGDSPASLGSRTG
jgi:hypothetical protein